MKKELILLESDYLEKGEPFEKILENAIQTYFGNMLSTPRQILENKLKYK